MSTPEADTAKPLPVVFGFAHTELSPAERRFFEETNPFGFVLFKRNCSEPEQLRRLIDDLRRTVQRDDAPVFIDQEGGRVARLGPPHWPKFPAARQFGVMYEKDAALGAEAMQVYARLLAHQLIKLGITVNCAPVLDLFVEGATSALGDRALSRKPMIVAALGRIWAETMLQNGVLPVIKHVPGHGRMVVDPHETLPVIFASRAELESEDFVPFEFLKDMPIAMNSHAVFKSLDAKSPASLSPTITQDVIRGRLGFDGLLVSDDLTMKALRGTPADIAQEALAAGTDILLHCDGNMEAMVAIAHALKRMSRESWSRWDYAKTMVKPAQPAYDMREDNDRLDILFGAMAFEDLSA